MQSWLSEKLRRVTRQADPTYCNSWLAKVEYKSSSGAIFRRYFEERFFVSIRKQIFSVLVYMLLGLIQDVGFDVNRCCVEAPIFRQDELEWFFIRFHPDEK